MIIYIEGKYIFSCILKVSSSNKKGHSEAKKDNIETYNHVLKFLYLDRVDDIMIKAILVVVASCNVLALGLQENAGSKVYYEIINEVNTKNASSKRKVYLSMILKKLFLNLLGMMIRIML